MYTMQTYQCRPKNFLAVSCVQFAVFYVRLDLFLELFLEHLLLCAKKAKFVGSLVLDFV